MAKALLGILHEVRQEPAAFEVPEVPTPHEAHEVLLGPKVAADCLDGLSIDDEVLGGHEGHPRWSEVLVEGHLFPKLDPVVLLLLVEGAVEELLPHELEDPSIRVEVHSTREATRRFLRQGHEALQAHCMLSPSIRTLSRNRRRTWRSLRARRGGRARRLLFPRVRLTTRRPRRNTIVRKVGERHILGARGPKHGSMNPIA